MAKASDQIKSADITLWAIVAIVAWAVAILGGNITALVPDSVFAGLHASRLEGANLNQLRSQVTTLESQSARLKEENSVLLQRFVLNEQQNGDVTRRVGALELSIPKLLEALPVDTDLDRNTITASTGNPAVTTFDTEGGSVAVSQTPLSAAAPVQLAADAVPQEMPAALHPAPDASAFGVALGPPIDPDEAELNWQSLNNRIGPLLLGLGPLIADSETSSGKRMVAGPLGSEREANQLCGRVTKVGIACSPVPFIGDNLPLLN